MTLSNSVAAVFLVSVFFIGYIQADSTVTKFVKQVRNIIPEDTYMKVFAVNFDNLDQLLEGSQKASDIFNKIVGNEIKKSDQKTFSEEFIQLADILNSSILYQIYATTIGQTLKDLGKLNSGNVKEMAQKWANELNKSAKSLKNTNVVSTFPAMSAANGRLFKDLGLTSSDDLNQLAKNLINEKAKFIKKA